MKEVREDDCLGWAAQLAYYLLFAVFPFFLFLTALLGFLPIPNLMERIIAGLAMVLPGEAVTLLQDNIRQLVTEQKGGLLSFGILAALWSSSSAVVAITAALNQAYDVEEGRPWWKVRGIALLLTMGLSLFLLLAVVLLIFGPQLGRGLASLVGLGAVFEILWNILRWPVSAGLLIGGAGAGVLFCAGCRARVEVDHARGDLCGPGDPARLARLFAVCQPLWVLQQNVWQSWRGDCLSHLVISDRVVPAGGGRDQRRDRACRARRQSARAQDRRLGGAAHAPVLRGSCAKDRGVCVMVRSLLRMPRGGPVAWGGRDGGHPLVSAGAASRQSRPRPP